MFNNIFTLTGASPSTGSSIISIVLMMLGWLAVFYLILILPNKKKAKKHQNMVDALKVGDEVITVGGIKAEVASIIDEYIELKVDKKGNRITVKKSAVSTILNK